MRKWILSFGAVLFLSACSYSLRKGDQPLAKLDGKAAASGIQSIYIPVIENLSSTVAPESVLTEALREVFSTQPGLKVVSDESKAEYVLLGRVSHYGTRFFNPTSPSSRAAEDAGGLVENQVTAADIKVYLQADFELLENTSADMRRSLWSKGIQEETSFEAFNRQNELLGSSSAPHINRSREYLQLRKMSRNMARKILDQVSQDF
ncbi:hypothetical protein GW916_04380 [bacterium]|nr:hypothetical protein [bacterium]